MSDTTFDALIAPLQEFFKLHSEQIDKESGSRKLLFTSFTLTMLYSLMMQIESLRKVSNHLKYSDAVPKVGLQYFAWTTIRDGFTRFSCQHFMNLYRSVVAQTQIFKLKSLDEVGLISLVDGSLFPTIISMCWAEYKTTKKAIRLHVEMSLNQMIPLEFAGLSGNSSERDFLKTIVRNSVTYIADRGYFSFDLAHFICKHFAFFIFRIRNNMKMDIGKALQVSGAIPKCLSNVTDQLIRFTNDPHNRVYRVICFTVLQSEFKLCTNRLELTTLEIIMLYAYRWQVELLFKFVKRTLKGLHLFNHSKNGVNIQFCLLMILSVVYLNMRQFCKITTATVKFQENPVHAQPSTMSFFNSFSEHNPEKWINSINRAFNDLWKISSYWVQNIKDFLAKVFDFQIVESLATP